MMELTEQQRQELRLGRPVCIHSPEVGPECVLLRADVYERFSSLLEEDQPDMRAVGMLIEKNQREDDENDPLLESYQ